MSFSQLACLSSFLIAVYLNVCVCQGVNCNNCCSNTTYKEINEPRRSIKSVWQSGQRALCDRNLRSGWYRFTSDAGGKVMMPENTVPEYHCGTHDPIWLNGSHPTVAEGNVVRKVCINSFGSVCDDTLDINVTNCGDYYVYYLKTVDYCAVAYCAGEQCTVLSHVLFPFNALVSGHPGERGVGGGSLGTYADMGRDLFTLVSNFKPAMGI